MPASARPLVIAHRGASGHRPEHSRAAFELALRQGADAVEPDLVATRDGVLVIRHENEISGTTDVAAHAEFADRRTTKVIDGTALTGWFTEDFTWPELSTLRVRERLPELRPANTAFDGQQRMLRLSELLPMIDAASAAAGRQRLLVAELKHASYFASIGLPLDELLTHELGEWANDDRLSVESFEQGVLDRVRERGMPGRRVYLLQASGTAADLRATLGDRAPSYTEQLSEVGLARLAEAVDGISVPKSLLLQSDAAKRSASGHTAATTSLVDRAHALGLSVFTWTLRPENAFLAKRHRVGHDRAAWGDWRAEFAAVMRAGVDGVFADHPDLALEVRDALADSDSDRDSRRDPQR